MHKKLLNTYIFIDKLNHQIIKHINTKTGVIYRNYSSKNRHETLIKIAEICKKKRSQLFISNNLELVLKVKADGIYIPSFSKSHNFNLNLNKKIMVLGSAHNQMEIHNKISQKCHAIFLSPAFLTNKYKSKKYLGIARFNLLCLRNKINFYALGGINEKNLPKLKLLRIKGYGGISLFKKKPAQNMGRFLNFKF